MGCFVVQSSCTGVLVDALRTIDSTRSSTGICSSKRLAAVSANLSLCANNRQQLMLLQQTPMQSTRAGGSAHSAPAPVKSGDNSRAKRSAAAARVNGAAATTATKAKRSRAADTVLELGAPSLHTMGATNNTRSPELLGDKSCIRKTFARFVVDTIMVDHPGCIIGDLNILELGSGAGFFARAYHDVYDDWHGKLTQTDADPQQEGVAALDVSELSSFGQQFDVVLSIDVLSCLAFGAGLDSDDVEDIDALERLNEGLRCVLAEGGAYYDFMACAPNSQFVLRFVPEYCRTRPGRFICVLDPSSNNGSEQEEDESLLFVTFDVSLLRHVDAEAGLLLQVTGHEAPFTYTSLCETICPAIREQESVAFVHKVLEFLFRDINVGGCPTNWELLSYVFVDPAHFSEVFEDDDERMVSVFLDTFRAAVLFLRESFKGKSASYEELRVVDAFRSIVETNLTDYAVKSTEVDVNGSEGSHYTQRYHYAHVRDGDPNGNGSFRCMVTKCEIASQR